MTIRAPRNLGVHRKQNVLDGWLSSLNKHVQTSVDGVVDRNLAVVARQNDTSGACGGQNFIRDGQLHRLLNLRLIHNNLSILLLGQLESSLDRLLVLGSA